MQAAAPVFQTARLLSLLGTGIDAFRVFAYVLILAAALGVFIALYNAMKERAYDLAIMAVGATESQYQHIAYYWQIYEVTGLGIEDTPVITKLANQPVDFNNVSPVYGTDDRILFTSDRPRNGERHLYPQRDEYESAPTVTGIWSLDPATGDLFLMNHSPSGNFSPFIDSFGRVLSTRWDHLQRDQQNYAGSASGAFNWTDESISSTKTTSYDEVFPEALAAVGDINGHARVIRAQAQVPKALAEAFRNGQLLGERT